MAGSPDHRSRTGRTTKYIGTDVFWGMPSTAPPAPADSAADAPSHVMDSLRRIVRVLGASARGPAARHGATGAQLFVLRQIDAAPGLSIGELAARTLTGQSTVSEVVTRLVERRLVARRASTTHARPSELTPTPSGRRAIAAGEPPPQGPPPRP